MIHVEGHKASYPTILFSYLTSSSRTQQTLVVSDIPFPRPKQDMRAGSAELRAAPIYGCAQCPWKSRIGQLLSRLRARICK